MDIQLSVYNAASTGSVGELRRLLDARPDLVDAAGPPPGHSPLWIACFGGHAGAAELLIRSGAALPADASGRSPLWIAASNGHCEVVEVLAAAGHPLDAPDRNGWTPLMAAARHGRVDAVRLLLALGADRDARAGGGGGTARDLALANGCRRVVAALDADKPLRVPDSVEEIRRRLRVPVEPAQEIAAAPPPTTALVKSCPLDNHRHVLVIAHSTIGTCLIC